MQVFQIIKSKALWSVFLLMLSSVFIACDDEESRSEQPVIRLAGEEAGDTAGTEPGTMAGTMAGMMAGTTAGSTAGMMGGGEMPLVRTITNCEELCGVYESCGEAEAHPWGECLTGCMGESWEDQGFMSYVSCLKLEPCESIDACRIPPPPLPSCEEACAQLDVCGLEYRFPQELLQNTECSTACSDMQWARQISTCVQANERRLCEDTDFFDRCILDERGGQCLSICEAQANCDENLDLIDCALSCLSEAPSGDALATYRQEQAETCVLNANGCTELSTCLESTSEPVSQLAEQVCSAANECSVFAEDACPELANRALLELSNEGMNCLIDSLTNDCDADLTGCFNQTEAANDSACSDYCFISNLCDTLPAEQSEVDCVEECQMLAATGDPIAFAPYQSQIACADQNSCQAFGDCLSGSGTGDACADLCTQRASCGLEEEGACLSRCNSLYATERSRRERTCGALLSCESSELCQIPEAPNCESFCTPLAECNLASADCITQCDNAELYQPEAHLPRLTCVNASERCDYVATCFDDSSNANACLNYCAYQNSCATGNELGQATEACALACARGDLPETEANTFIPSADCLAELEPSNTSCNEISNCFSSAPSLCEELCNLANSCALPLSGELANNCISACEAGDIPSSEQLCAVSADQREAGCGAVANCLGFPVPEPTPACAEYCSALKTCDPSVDLYTCHSECIADASGDGVRAACTSLVTCDEINLCQDEGAEASVACMRACQDLEDQCVITGENELFDSLNACADQCGGLALALGEESTEALVECAANAECDNESLNACFSGEFAPASREICERSWNALEQCGFLSFIMVPEAQFYVDCDAEYQADPAGTITRVECLETAFQSDPTCFSAILDPACGIF